MHRLTTKLILFLLSCALLAACSPAPQGGKATGADFLLQGPSGPVDSHNFRGKLMLVFFGYVNCPDVCPTSLAAMNEVLSGMTPEERAKIQPADPNKPVTGLILNLEGQPFERELLPIVATKGEGNLYLTVYSAKLVEPKIIRTHGVVRYQTSVEQAKKQPWVGENVLVVPVEIITKENMIIIPLEAAKIISETNRYGNNYLSEGKVVIADR